MRIARTVFLVFSLVGLPVGAHAQAFESQPSSQTSYSVRFDGLRRVPETAVRRILSLPMGTPLRRQNVRAAVTSLHRTGWFASVRVELRMRTEDAVEELVFVLEERPFLAGIEYHGSQRLDSPRIEAVLRDAGALPVLARPVDPLALHRAAEIIRRQLREQGHPEARITVREQSASAGAVHATFEVVDGPYLPVHKVDITGAPGFNADALRNQMREIRPGSWFAGLRGKNVYTGEKLAADAASIERYLHNHGHPFARAGTPQVRRAAIRSWAWWPWPRRRTQNRLEIALLVSPGQHVAWNSAAVLDYEGRTRDELLVADWQPGEPYSVEKIQRTKTNLERALRCGDARAEVQALPAIDRASGAAHVEFRAAPAEPFRIRHIEFSGHHRFPERFYRRRLGLTETDAYSEEKLQQGLAAVTHGGFVERPATEDVALHFDPESRVVDVRIRVREAGRQRISLIGGASSVGLAYNLFNLLGGEELLTGYLEGGPASLQLALGIARDGLLGNRAALGFSLFHNVLQPRLPGGRGEKLFISKTMGVSQSFTFRRSNRQAATVQYQLSRNSLEVPARASGSAPAQSTHFSKSEVSASWEHNSGATRISTRGDVAGGWLGGQQHVWRTSSEAVILRPDAFSAGRNHWAARLRSEGAFDAPRGRAAPDCRFTHAFMRVPSGCADSARESSPRTEAPA